MRVVRLVVPFLASILCVVTSSAQDNPNLQNGIVPFGSFNGGAIDSVNVFNGNLNIHIPLFNYPQRGSLPGQLMITGNTKSFFVAQSCNPQLQTCTLHWNTQNLGVGIAQVSDELGLQTPWRSNTANGLYVLSWDGSSHQMWGGLSLDGSGIFMNNAFPPTQFLNKNGNGTPSSSGNIQQQDTNGNYFNWTSIGASYTDTLGRTFTGTYPGPNGTTMQVQITSVNVTIQTNFQASGTDMYQNLDPITEYGPINVNLIQSIAVYDGNSWATSPTWTFQYNDRDPGDLTQNPKTDTEEIRGKLGRNCEGGGQDDAQERSHGRANRCGVTAGGRRSTSGGCLSEGRDQRGDVLLVEAAVFGSGSQRAA